MVSDGRISRSRSSPHQQGEVDDSGMVLYMLSAFRRKKLPQEMRERLARMEDVVTSTVWGHLRYLPWS